MLDFKGSLIAEGIPVFIPGAVAIVSIDEAPELGVMSGIPFCSMADPEGGVTDVGGVFMVAPLCEPGAC